MIEVSLLSIQLTKENNIILYISIGKEKEIKKKKRWIYSTNDMLLFLLKV